MAEINLAAVCGIYCGGCKYLDEMCKGCSAEKGKVFWTRLEEIPWNICPIWECCVDQKGLEHCGLCSDFPCSTYLGLKDPSDPEADLHKRQSIESLKHRTEVGTTGWLEEQERLSKNRRPSATD
jgi:hypothetical protein